MKKCIVFFLAAAAIAASTTPTRAGVFFVAIESSGKIGQYNSSNGATINAAFISGLSAPRGLDLSNGDLYVSSYSNGTIGQYDARTGTPVNASLITGQINATSIAVSGSDVYITNSNGLSVKEYTPSGLAFTSPASNPWGVAVLGNFLFVANQGNYRAGQGTVAEYDATTGALLNASFITGLNAPEGITISGNNMYVVNNADLVTVNDNTVLTNGTIGKYNATTGTVINASLVTGLDQPVAAVVVGSDLYVTSNPFSATSGLVGQFDATTGAPINTSFITGLNDPQWLVYLAPEPATWAMLAIGAVALLAFGRARRKVPLN